MLVTVVVIRALKPTRLTSSLMAVSTIVLGDILSQINHIKTIVFQQHLHDILANIMDVSLDCGQNDLILFSISPPLFASSSFNTAKAILAASALIRSCGRKTVPFSNPFPTTSRAGIRYWLIMESGSCSLEASASHGALLP